VHRVTNEFETQVWILDLAKTSWYASAGVGQLHFAFAGPLVKFTRAWALLPPNHVIHFRHSDEGWLCLIITIARQGLCECNGQHSSRPHRHLSSCDRDKLVRVLFYLKTCHIQLGSGSLMGDIFFVLAWNQVFWSPTRLYLSRLHCRVTRLCCGTFVWG